MRFYLPFLTTTTILSAGLSTALTTERRLKSTKSSKKSSKSSSSSSSSGGGEETTAPAPPECNVKAYEFSWRGQFAGFMVNGRFSYDADGSYFRGIVRESDLIDLSIHFYDPQGNHLKSYTENQNVENVNFAFSTLSQELLQDGTWNVDDDELFYRNGFMMGEGNPDLRYEDGVQSGLAFWSRPADNKTPHLHVDDWDDANGDGEFKFPIAYSSHEDASFAYATTQSKIDGGKVGTAYYGDGVNKLASDVQAMGQMVTVTPVAPNAMEKNGC